MLWMNYNIIDLESNKFIAYLKKLLIWFSQYIFLNMYVY